MKISFVFLCSLLVFTCKERREQNISANNPINIKIHLNGVDQSTIDEFGLVAKLSTCTEATGTYVSDSTYSFSVQSVKKSDVCSLQLMGPSSADAGVEFFDSSSTGIYFEADTVTISEEFNGALSATAYLEKVYTKKIQPGLSTWKIEAALTNDTAFTTPCTCRIQCTPAITNDATVLTAESPATKGSCIFDNVAKEKTANSTCDQIVVQCSGQIFIGKWAAAPSVSTLAGKTNKLPELKVVPATVSTEGNVEITPVILKPTK